MQGVHYGQAVVEHPVLRIGYDLLHPGRGGLGGGTVVMALVVGLSEL
jgi:hypothetical protein